ncbi:F-box protein At5g65850-like [Papaver somniferum]|uniref:F-box protein At5g65850-like n=1 Tax=Papaver somniferum TaxID=3469 RepID=UPI000E705362|nr:F-box protein At5g65850-like [Papaver somniferum]
MGNFNKLPVNLISNILTRLPTESVLDCKLVSKSWNNVISRQQFSQSHLNHCLNNLRSAGASGGKSTFLFLNENPLDAYRQFHYFEYAENSSSEEQPFHKITRMKLNPAPFKYYSVVGSCNGLVCLNGCHDNEGKNYEPVYICNPITRECVFLPEFERTHDRGERLLTGFGYDSETNEYKVVRLYKLLKEPNFLHAEVYTLGSGKGWRKIIQKFEADLDSFISIHGMLMSELEFLCWQLKTGKLLAFVLSSEVIAEIPTNSSTTWGYKLGVFGSCLSGTYYDEDSDTYEIVVLKRLRENGVVFKWIEEFSLSDTDAHEWLGLTCRRALLCYSETKVLIQDLNSVSSELLVDFGKDKEIFQAVPHMNTLVSLKALGEENTNTMETADIPREVLEEYKSQFEKQQMVMGLLEMCVQQ